MGLFYTTTDQNWQTRTAVFSPTRKYRYRLETMWDPWHPVLVGLFCNPSIADERRQDNTDRLFRARALKLGYGGTCLVNMFAFVATRPELLWDVPDPIGPENNRYIVEACQAYQDVFCGWGLHGNKNGRAIQVLTLLKKSVPMGNRFYCLKLTKDNQPCHPLYIKNATPLSLCRFLFGACEKSHT